MIKKKLIILLTGLFLFSSNSYNVLALERYSSYKDNIDISKVSENKIRLKQIDKESNNISSIASKYEYNANGKITFRDYKEGSINYEYDDEGRVLKVINKLKPNIDTTGLLIKHVFNNSISEYTYDGNKIKKEIKKIYKPSDTSFSEPPEKIYKIDYYYDGNQLSRKSYTPRLDTDENKEYTSFSYDNLGRIEKITERKNSRNDTLSLEYDTDGDITKAIQLINGKQTTIEISYINDRNKFYPIYYVDPIKEPKIDIDFFASSYKLISQMKITDFSGEKIFTYNYIFGNDNESNVPIESTLNVKINNFEFNTKFKLKY